MAGIEGNQMENIQRIILSKRTWQLLSLMSLPGINFCLKDSEVWGNWCWVDSKQSSDLKHLQEKDPRVVFCFCQGGCCVVLCPPVLTWSSCGCAGCMWGAWSMQVVGAGLSRVGYLAAGCLSGVNSLCQSVRQAGRQKAHPGRGLSVRLFFLNFPPRHTILRSHFFLPQEAQENTIASSLTAKLNPGLLYPARFEKLDITPKSAQKIKPVLERWMAEAEARHRAGMQNLTEFIGSEPSKKRKRRTSFTPQALEILNAHFEKNTHPSGQEMTEIAEKLNYDREVVRVWFCNKRQALKNTIKRLKQHEPTTAVPLEPLTDSLEENS